MENTKILAVNVENDEQMVQEGLRLPKLVGRDKSLWSKSQEERDMLRAMKTKGMSGAWLPPKKMSGIKHRLTVYLKDKTKSHSCYSREVYMILKSYKDAGNLVDRYSYNGKTYYMSKNEFPEVLKMNSRL